MKREAGIPKMQSVPVMMSTKPALKDLAGDGC